MAKYANHGRPWDAYEDDQLWFMRLNGDTIRECARQLARSQYAVDIRWRRLKRERMAPLPPLPVADEESV